MIKGEVFVPRFILAVYPFVGLHRVVLSDLAGPGVMGISGV
jgi:hypothetical protein